MMNQPADGGDAAAGAGFDPHDFNRFAMCAGVCAHVRVCVCVRACACELVFVLECLSEGPEKEGTPVAFSQDPLERARVKSRARDALVDQT